MVTFSLSHAAPCRKSASPPADLEQVIGIRAEHGVNFRGIAVAQVLAQQAAAQARAGGGAAFPASRGSRRAGPRTRPAYRAAGPGLPAPSAGHGFPAPRSGLQDRRALLLFAAARATSIRRRYRAAGCASARRYPAAGRSGASISVPPVRRPAPQAQLQPTRGTALWTMRDRAARAAPA